MATYVVQFGGGNPATFTGLSPTFSIFRAIGVGATTPPGITEVAAGVGLYYFSYAPLSPVAFVIDGTSSIATANRYVAGGLDPSDNTSASNAAALVTLGSYLGSLTDAVGGTLAQPTTITGFLRRIQEDLEGNNVFTKSSGQLQIWSRGVTYAFGSSVYAGSSLMLIAKTVDDDGSIITKT